jgi:sentrin-specific protease 1
MVGSHRATVLDNTPTRHTTMTPLFNEIEKQHFSSQYFCVLSTWAERKTAKKNDEDPRRKETASIHTVLRESVHHRTPVQRVEKTPSPSSSPAIQLWSSSCPSSGREERRDRRRRKEYSDVRGKLPDSVEKTVNNAAPKDHSPWWSKSARTTRPFYPSIRTGQYDHLQTMFHYLKKDMMDDRKDFEAQRTALEKIVTLAREERERFVDDSAKRVLRGDEGETEMSLELSPQQENTVREVWNYGNEDDSYSTAFSIVIKRCDLHTLPPSTWLNDAVINFYFNLIAQRSQGKDSPCRAHCMRTFFYPKLLDAGYSGVRRWTKKVDIFKDFDIVLIPVHLGVHWTLAVVDLKRKQVVYYDSLLGDNRVCLTALLDWLVQEAKDKKGMQYNVSDWKRLTPKDIPRQQNSSDCGVFTCMFARYYTKNEPFSFKQDDMPQIRKKMVCEIIEKRLF